MDVAPLALLSKAFPALPLSKTLQFLRFAQMLKPTLEVHVQDNRRAPDEMPGFAKEILSKIIQESILVVSKLWDIFRDYVWQASTSISPNDEEIKVFNRYALPLGTSYYHLYPPTRVCKTFNCKNYRVSNEIKTLTEPLTHKATLFTLREGSLPVYTTSLYCRNCNRRYYHNNSVHKRSNTREYYGGVPNVIQASQNYFIGVDLLELFAAGKTFGWLSAMNCSRLFDMAIASRHAYAVNNPLAFMKDPEETRWIHETKMEWQTSMLIREKDVLNGFFLYSLLLSKAEQERILYLAHDKPSQSDRLRDALAERNKEMEGIGQEAYTHACDLCFLVTEDEEGRKFKIRAAVCDGVTVGHPCCGVHDCKEPLANLRQRFCALHDKENRLQCAVITCKTACQQGFRTCSLSEHRALETAYFQRRKALFQLQAKLKRAGVVPLNSVPLDDTDESVDDDEEEVSVETDACDGKPETGNRTFKAFFGRRRTHNEQLIMRPCGVILSRATFFGSEAVSAVNTFVKATFPTPESTPEFFVFDNNCKLLAHQKKIGDKHFENTGMPVDVFHFKSKHKETDLHCQRFCNPAAFPELIKDGQWQVNTSICEQGNVWVGGYQAILRGMEMTRYNFYLDEVIKRRNRYVISCLEARGKRPWSVPISDIFPST